jgi:hypothetical protein
MMLETLRRFLRAWLLGSMSLAGLGTAVHAWDQFPGWGPELVALVASYFIVLTMVAAVPVLAVMAMKWIIFG